jgi:hAT family C-terminal dimerisation region
VKEILQPAYELTIQASGQYATLSTQPLIFESLIKHCQEFIRRSMTTEIEAPVAAEAAEVMIAKLEKYKCYLTCELSRLALALDPAIPNTSTEVEAMKVLIRETLVREYGMTVQHAPTQSQRGLLAAARAARAPSRGLNIISDEVDDYFDFTRMGDESCNDAVEWWATIGIKRFPAMAALARDTLMCMGSSLPSESSFSDSGHFVSADRAKLNDANIEIMMKLRSWNRLLQKIK